MQFNSLEFLLFFPIAVMIYFVVPKKMRCVWLLIASYFFYMCWNPWYSLLILTSTVVTFASGLLIERFSDVRRKKVTVALSLVINLGILFAFKYSNFLIHNINMLCRYLRIDWSVGKFDILLPIGISFYTFQAIGYTIDVYRGKITAERNFINYALFVSFFPQLVAGPIERSGNLLKQIRNVRDIKVWNSERIREGLLLMFWGLFQKLVIADRASILVNTVYNSYNKYGFVELGLAMILFAVQIYCDFCGYTNIARGAAKVMGFSLSDNFRQPFFATSVRELWRRWHMSLTSWFTDYLYIPLGGNRKGTIRKYINTLIVFTLSGLWHGAAWHYIIWGIIQAVLIIGGATKEKIKAKIHTPISGPEKMLFSTRIFRMTITFSFFSSSFVFFASDSIGGALGVFKNMFSRFSTVGIYQIGLDRGNLQILFLAIIVLLVVDILHEKNKSVFALICSQGKWTEIIVFVILIWSIILIGIYGVEYDASQFIYFQF